MNLHITEAGQAVVYYEDEHHLKDNFERFDRDNPHVYTTLCDLTRQWVDGGYGKLGIGMLFEVTRWKLRMSTVGEPIKLNNNYRAFYARKIMAEHPQWDGVFETRRQKG